MNPNVNPNYNCTKYESSTVLIEYCVEHLVDYSSSLLD